MKITNELKKSFFIALWFILLTFPIMVIRVNTIEQVVVWRLANLLYVGIGSFALSFLWQIFLKKKKSVCSNYPLDALASKTIA